MVIHFSLREKDGDLMYWKESLPRFTFNRYVRAALFAEKSKTVADIPVPPTRGTSKRTVETKLYFYDRELIQMVRACPVRKKAHYIKTVLRNQIEANYQKAAEARKPQPQIEQSPAANDDYRRMLLEMAGKSK